MLSTLLLAASLVANSVDTLHYELTVARDDSMRRVIDVRVRFGGNARGRTIIELPHSWAGHSDLERAVSRLSVVRPSTAKLSPGDSAHRWLVTYAPGASVELRYRVRQDWSGVVRRPLYFRALIDSDYAILVGQNSLVHPAYRDGDSLVVDIAWKNVPARWLVASSFGEGKTQRARTTINDLLEGVFVAGQFRAYATTASGRPMRVMVRGGWNFADSALVRSARDILTRQREFWHDKAARYYLIAAIPASGGIGGTAFTHALVMYADSASRLPAFAGLLSHETFHEWNGRAIRTAGPEGGMKWLSEGFTEYFADRFARDAGFLSNEAYIGKANDAIRHYYTSRVRNATRDDVNRAYWSDADMNRFPYYQGYLIAGFLDGELRNATGGRFTIDSLLFAVYRRVRGSSRLVDDSVFTNAAPAIIRGAVRDSIRSFVAEGHTVPVTDRAFDGCLEVRNEPMYPFDLGFDAPASTRDRVVRGVRPGGTADSAGLRDGMRLRGWSWFNGDPTKAASVRVPDGDTVRTISWMPRGAEPVSVPQLSPRTC